MDAVVSHLAANAALISPGDLVLVSLIHPH